MKKLFSLNTLAHAARQCAQRFPITVVFIAMLTIYLVIMAWGEHYVFSDRVDSTVCYYLGLGTLLTTVLQLWGEEVKNKRTRLVANAVAHIALIADTAYIYSIYGHASMEIFLAHASVITALSLSMFILPFYREKNDIASWNFTLQLLLSGCTSWIIGGIMCGGICLLTAAVEELFGLDLSNNWTETWCILFMYTLPTLLFIGRIPDGEEKHDRIPRISAFLNKSIRYLFLPLLGCYMIVLYGYLGKIIIEWQLPDGWVSKLVSVLTFGSIAVVLCLYPKLHKGASKTDNRIVRFLPLAILPLLVLMTVGIVRRFSDYGITVNRLYLLTLNIWFYLVCIWLYLSRARRIWWISASFALFFMLTSVLPFNISSFTRNWIYGKIETTIKDNYKGKLPMSEETYLNWLKTLPADEALQLNSRLKYLHWELSDKTTNTLVSDSVSWWNAENLIDKKSDVKTKDDYIFCYSRSEDKRTEIKLGYQYSSMIVYTETEATLPRTQSRTMQVPIYKDEQTIDTLQINIDDIRKWSALSNFAPRTIKCSQKGNSFVLTAFVFQSISDNKEYSLKYSGYYLIKK